MENSTKYCITTIIIATIWFLGQPIGGNVSIEASFDKVPYFNLTNSTIGGSAEISGYMPVGVLVPLLVFDILREFSKIPILLMGGIITTILAIYIFYTTRRK